jgi:hypothetical protein
MSGFDFLIF